MKLSKEHRQKISKSMQGIKNSEKTKMLKSKLYQNLLPKLNEWKPLLVERSYKMIEMACKHEVGEINDSELCEFIVKNIPIKMEAKK